MKKPTFEERVNLYLDREISTEQLELLKSELASSDDRLREFKFRCQLHRATRMALSADVSSVSKQQLKAKETQRLRLLLSLRTSLEIAACLGVAFVIFGALVRAPESNQIETGVLVAREFKQVKSFEDTQFRVSPQSSFAPQPQLASLTTEASRLNQSFDYQELYTKPVVIQQHNPYKAYNNVSDSSLLNSFEPRYEVPQSYQWPAGFKSSLANF